MKTLTLTLALTCFLCTCGRAQKLPMDVTSVAFIKSENGFLIDSISLHTSLDTIPYGFSFPGDTLLLDISIFKPVDELTIKTFASGHTFGERTCWVDGPTADIYLSIGAGKTVVDSVSLSPIDTWYRKELILLSGTRNLKQFKTALSRNIFETLDILPAANFLKAYLNLPNLERKEVQSVSETLLNQIGWIRKHPRFKSELAKMKILTSNKPGKLSKYKVIYPNGNVGEIAPTETPYYVLNFYKANLAQVRLEHQRIQASLEVDSFFVDVPVISITDNEDFEAWGQYLKEGQFSWPHYSEPTNLSGSLIQTMAFYPGSTYVLLNRRHRIVGIYNDLDQLVSAIRWRKIEAKKAKP